MTTAAIEKTYTCKDKNGNLKLDIETLTKDIIDEHEFLCLPDTEEVLVYDNGYWRYGGEEVIKAEAEYRVGLNKVLTTHAVNEVIGHIQRSTYKPRWLLNRQPELINLKNGILDIRARELKPHTPEFLCTIRIPVTFDPGADCPRIKRFFAEVLEPQDIPVIEELFGYCLIPDYSIQKALLFVGDGSNGKSTLLNLLKAFIGKENVSNVPWHALELDRFAKSALEGKLVNMFADIPSQGLSYTGAFKMLTGGDSIGTEKKFRDYFSFTNFARLVFSSNKPPKIYQEDSYAFWRRWIVLNFPNQFVGDNEDKQLLGKLTTEGELSGLLNIALDGLDRLFKNQGYSYGKSVEETTEIYMRVSDPVYAFLQDLCDGTPNKWVSKDDLYRLFCLYCEGNAIPLLKPNSFARSLQNQAHFKVTSTRPEVNKERITAWQGISVKDVKDVKDFSLLKTILMTYSNNKIGENPDIPDNPDAKAICPTCGGTDWWQRVTGEWVCQRCHPDPYKNKNKRG
jgi:putative DNA primase/helicase